MSGLDYAELHCLSNFSFQRGASSADELFKRAKALGYQALAITDECTLAGIVRAWQAARQEGVRLIVGSEVQLHGGAKLVLLVESLEGYQNLCALITRARRRSEKGTYQLLREDLQAHCQGLLALWVAQPGDAPANGLWLKSLFGERLWLAVHLHRGCDDARRLQQLHVLAGQVGIRAVACGDVHMHVRGRRALQDCMTAIRQHCTLAEAGRYLYPNGERHLRTLTELGELYPPDLLAETQVIAHRCRFGLDELKYQYPSEVVPQGHTPASWLRHLCQSRLPERWPQGVSRKALDTLDKELRLITELGYESYFLTVYDIVDFARKQGILCQGRGSAANSVVCFVLGITELDPMEHRLLFERFLSRERNEPPDIDVDFEHDRREEVIQYVFRRYGRDRAALTAVVNTYHAAGAIRDVARALGLPADQVDALAKCCGRWSDRIPDVQRLAEAGFEAQSPSLQRILVLAGQLIGFPRHLSQHPGGFVICQQPLDRLVPVENAAMAQRTVIQWDKDDLDLVGLLKVDVLALGMLSALRRCFDLLARHRDRHLTLATIPKEDPATYAMISRAETMGVFQIESRAQMAMLPRLKPKKFYDLVIEVAIVRPGPIQGDMVHPYLRRRLKQEKVTYPSPELEAVFERTLGVPLFQEQVMELAMIAADYTPGEADQLRRSMAAWKRHGGLEPHRERLINGMLKNRYERAFAERIFEQIKGFGSYGFPESHAASFALLCYASSWLKCHEPAIFTCALINSWPMGFYSPDQLLQEARRQGIEVRPVDVCHSEWDCTLEPHGEGALAIRLGLRQIRGFSEADARRLEQARARQPWRDVEDLCLRAELDSRARARLADAGALRALARDRHQARWQVAAVQAQLPLFAQVEAAPEVAVELPVPSVAEDLFADYATLGTTLGPHPLALLRRNLRALGCRSSAELADVEHGDSIAVAGVVVGRQRPQTASGVTFVTLEDEHGMVNVVVWRDLAERQRRALVGSQLLKVSGRLEQEKGVRHLIARRLEDISPLLQGLDVRSRDFH
ncbi:DNA polymerase III subunit alpha [Pseudomonas putida]|nr:error-prone DNA polymerase [Pseudomonas guariconensis]CAB5520057.1 DNA polymerase III subunit alpha [Pseudomonas putida]CAB5520589.1 DNA polymerase III subunit alpha [Pseudomonas putida]CAB5537315.1 DNA polymerase III subunit alpha [Pseudomonas putida]CAB5538766.1 DNA polymerase III subunit alpha [Pseudomonas putida]CAB5640061.1 DNA polymerase III subunit alpha [Pseudomonas putida]